MFIVEMFHPRCGPCVLLSNGNKTACRTNPHHEFNRGLVFSLEPIKDNEVFEVKIDKKLNTWSGSVEIGVTVCNPDVIDIPCTVTDLRGGTWVLLGHGVLRDGKSLVEAYGCDLDQLVEGDRVGVMRSTGGALEFYVNGEGQGVAALGLPPLLYAVVDMYGKCAQITVTNPTHSPDSNTLDVDSPSELSASISETSNQNQCPSAVNNQLVEYKSNIGSNVVIHDSLLLANNNTNEDAEMSCVLDTDRCSILHEEDVLSDQLSMLPRTGQLDTPPEATSSPHNTDRPDNNRRTVLEEDGDLMSTVRTHMNLLGAVATDSHFALSETVNNYSDHYSGVSNAERKRQRPKDDRSRDVDNDLAAGFGDSASVHDYCDVADKGNEKESKVTANCTNFRAVNGTICPVSGVRDSNIILSNTEHLCRLLNVTMESILRDSDSSLISAANIGARSLNNVFQEINLTSDHQPISQQECVTARSSRLHRLDRPQLSHDGFIRNFNNDALSFLSRSQEDDLISTPDSSRLQNNIGNVDLPLNFETLRVSSTLHSDVDSGRRRVFLDRQLLANRRSLSFSSCSCGESGSFTCSKADCRNRAAAARDNIRSISSSCTPVRNSFRRSGSSYPSSSPPRVESVFSGNGPELLVSEANSTTILDNSPTAVTANSLLPASATFTSINHFNGINNFDSDGNANEIGEPSPSHVSNCNNVGRSNTNGDENTQDGRFNQCEEGDGGEGSYTGGGQSPEVIERTSNNNQIDPLRFHDKCGQLVSISNGGRTAERIRPLDEFNNGVVMSNRALRENELFEIRIDRQVSKWSGSIEVGITTHDPALLEFPATMTNIRSGTTMMSGTGILRNGKGMIRQYGDFNLDELREGDRIGMMIRTGSTLHYFINGLEQGIAATDVPSPVWCVVDLYGMTVKVTLTDPDEDEREHPQVPLDQTLLFSPRCGKSAEVINGGLTAHRPRANEDFNNGVVLTNRPLMADEVLEVKLDTCVTKWAGSLEIGVTTHSPHQLDFPSTMTNVCDGKTWMMTGNGVMHNGATVIEEYGLNLDRLRTNDRVGVVRRADGTLHFFVNGISQGAAAEGVPETVYGVVDLYGQAAQATILHSRSIADRSTTDRAANGNQVALDVQTNNMSHQLPSGGALMLQNTPEGVSDNVGSAQQLRTDDREAGAPSASAVYSDLRFHHLHGRNARIIRDGLGAERPHADAEFNDAIVMSNRQLHEGEMFEVMVERVVGRWSGSLEAGVTAIHPEDIEFPSTMTDIDYDTWMLSGCSVMMNGVTIKNDYACDLDRLPVGTRIGMMRHSDATLHYYVNGVDMGSACSNLPTGLWAVIDLYGQCAQVSIVHNPISLEHSSGGVVSNQFTARKAGAAGSWVEVLPEVPSSRFQDVVPKAEEVRHSFSYIRGSLVTLSLGRARAFRTQASTESWPQGNASALTFSSSPLGNELFEVRLTRINHDLYGSVRIGLTTLPLQSNRSTPLLPLSLSEVYPVPLSDTWWVGGSTVYHNTNIVEESVPHHRALVYATEVIVPIVNLGTDARLQEDVDKAVTAPALVGEMNTAWNINVVKYDFCPDLSKLMCGDRIGVMRTADGCMRLFINDIDLGVAASGIPAGATVHAVVELHGNCVGIETTSYFLEYPPGNYRAERYPDERVREVTNAEASAGGAVSQDSLELVPPTQPTRALPSEPNNYLTHETGWPLVTVRQDVEGKSLGLPETAMSNGRNAIAATNLIPGVRVGVFHFSDEHGVNIILSSDRLHASRKIGYDGGLLCTTRPLTRNTMFRVALTGTNSGISGGLSIGLLCGALPKPLPRRSSELLCSSNCFLLTQQHVYHRSKKITSDYCPSLATLATGSVIGLLVDSDARLRVFINGNDCGVAAKNVPLNPFVIVDLYGSAVQVSIVTSDEGGSCGCIEQALRKKTQHNCNQRQQHRQQQQQMTNGKCQSSSVMDAFAIGHDETNKAVSQSLNDSENAENGSLTGRCQVNDNTNENYDNSSRNIASGNCRETVANNTYRTISCRENVPSVISATDHAYYKAKQKVSLTEGKHCKYEITCSHILSSLALPDAYFKREVTCYCESCHKMRGEEASYVKDNCIEYLRPIGWCQFGLVSGASDSVRDSWHMAYSPVSAWHVRKLLDRGELLFPSELGLGWPRGGAGSKEQDKDSDGSELCVSPNAFVAASSTTPSSFLDRMSGRSYSGRLLLQVALKPGAYKKVECGGAVRKAMPSSTTSASDKAMNSSVQWVTKERGATHLLALLIAVETQEK